MMSKFIAQIKRVIIEDGKEDATITMVIPKKEVTNLDMGNVEVTIKAKQQKMFDED